MQHHRFRRFFANGFVPAVLMAAALSVGPWLGGAGAPIGAAAVDYPNDPPTPSPTVSSSVQIGTHATATLGTVLANPAGLTLYTLSSDPMNGSSCTGQCVTFWPPVTVATGGSVTAAAGVSGTVGSFVRSDGSTQVVHDGRALYLYIGDSAPGDTNGEGIVAFGGTWHVALPGAATTPPPATACLRITGGTWNPPGNENHAPAINAESVKIKNTCTTRQSLTGWRVQDYHAGHVYHFPSGFTIGAGVTVTLFSGRGTRTSTHLYWGRTSGEVWGNASPERAYLRNAAGTVVSTYTPFSSTY